MNSRRKRKVDILATGELLVDFISTNFAEDLNDAMHFMRLPGGSPANLCMNMARLGNNTALAASIGQDDMGNFLYQYVENHGVNVDQLHQIDAPTTLILVTRSQGVSHFEAYRGADYQISDKQFPESLLQNISIFHTSCFGLSLEPARSAILDAAQKASAAGCQLSIDANYATKIWPDQKKAQQVLQKYIGLGAIVKISEIDWERLYNQPLKDPTLAAKYLLDCGAKAVCVTLGPQGCLVVNASVSHSLAGRQVKVKDTTGAGDAYWSGFLTAWLDGHDLLNCGLAGRRWPS